MAGTKIEILIPQGRYCNERGCKPIRCQFLFWGDDADYPEPVCALLGETLSYEEWQETKCGRSLDCIGVCKHKACPVPYREPKERE
jgi:hypothetical protein